MPLQAEEQQQPPWKLNLQAKANNFDSRIKATKAKPAALNFFRFSPRLKLSPVDISVKLKPETSIRWNTKCFNSKFLQKKKKKMKKILEKFRMRFANYRVIAARRSFNIIPLRWDGTLSLSRDGNLVSLLHCLKIWLFCGNGSMRNIKMGYYY